MTKFINNPVLQDAFAFGRELFGMPDFTVDDYDEKVRELVANAQVDASEHDAIETTIINQIESGFEFEEAMLIA